MARYLISYDLHSRRDYGSLWDALNRLGATRVLASVWVGTLVGPASVISEILSGAIDAEDSLAVVRLSAGGDWATIRPPLRTGADGPT